MLRRRSRGVGRLLRARRVECGMLRRSFLRPLLCLSEGRVPLRLALAPRRRQAIMQRALSRVCEHRARLAQPLKGDGGARVGALVRVNSHGGPLERLLHVHLGSSSRQIEGRIVLPGAKLENACD